MPGGASTSKSGKTWEAWVKTLGAGEGFTILPYSDYKDCKIPTDQRRIIWEQAAYKTIFANIKKPKKTSTEFLVENRGDVVRIECKWQSTSGSVDEKYPFMFLNAVLTMEEPTIVFAMGGEYFEDGRGADVHDWLDRACTTPPDWLSDTAKARHLSKELRVLTPNSFMGWFQKRFGK